MSQTTNDVIAHSVTRCIQQSILKLCNEQVSYRHSLQVLGVLSLTVDEQEAEVIIKINSTLKRTDMTSQQHAEMLGFSELTSPGNSGTFDSKSPKQLPIGSMTSAKKLSRLLDVGFSDKEIHLLDMKTFKKAAYGDGNGTFDENAKVEPQFRRNKEAVSSASQIASGVVTCSHNSIINGGNTRKNSSKETEDCSQEASFGGSVCGLGKARGRKQRFPIRLGFQTSGADLNANEIPMTKTASFILNSSGSIMEQLAHKNDNSKDALSKLTSVKQTTDDSSSERNLIDTVGGAADKSNSMLGENSADSSLGVDLSAGTKSPRADKISARNHAQSNDSVLSAACGSEKCHSSFASPDVASVFLSNTLSSSSVKCALNLSPRKSSANADFLQVRSSTAVNLSQAINLSCSAASKAEQPIDCLKTELNAEGKIPSGARLNLSKSNGEAGCYNHNSRFNNVSDSIRSLLPAALSRNGRQYQNGTLNLSRNLGNSSKTRILSPLNRPHAGTPILITPSTIANAYLRHSQTLAENGTQDVALNFSLHRKHMDGEKLQEQSQNLDRKPDSYFPIELARRETSERAFPPRSWDFSRNAHWHDLASRVGPISQHANRSLTYPSMLHLPPHLHNYFPGSNSNGFHGLGFQTEPTLEERLYKGRSLLDSLTSSDQTDQRTGDKALKRKRKKHTVKPQPATSGDQESADASPCRSQKTDDRLEGRYLLDSMTSPEANRKRRRRGADETLTADEIVEYMGVVDGCSVTASAMDLQGSLRPSTDEAVHRSAAGTFDCKYCAVVLDDLDAYLGHTVSAHSAYICHECGKIFTTKSSLLRHRPIHTGMRRFTCAICQRAFYRKDKCKAHIKKHLEMSAAAAEYGGQDVGRGLANGEVLEANVTGLNFEANAAMGRILGTSHELQGNGCVPMKRIKRHEKVKNLSVRRRCRENFRFGVGKKLKTHGMMRSMSGSVAQIEGSKDKRKLLSMSHERELDFKHSASANDLNVIKSGLESVTGKNDSNLDELRGFHLRNMFDIASCDVPILESRSLKAGGMGPSRNGSKYDHTRMVDHLMERAKVTRHDEREVSGNDSIREIPAESDVIRPVMIKSESGDSNEDLLSGSVERYLKVRSTSGIGEIGQKVTGMKDIEGTLIKAFECAELNVS